MDIRKAVPYRELCIYGYLSMNPSACRVSSAHRSRNLKIQPEAGAATDVVKMSVA
jgi:hypothetical protein